MKVITPNAYDFTANKHLSTVEVSGTKGYYTVYILLLHISFRISLYILILPQFTFSTTTTTTRIV